MIICENKTTTVDKNKTLSDYEMFEVWFNDESKFLYKRVAYDNESNNVTYMRIYERLGKTTFDFWTFRSTINFACMVEDYLGYYDGFTINKVAKIDFPNLNVTYSY